MLKNNAVTADKILPNIVSSIDGVTNDGSNIDLEAGANITITPDDANNKITISASGSGGGDTVDGGAVMVWGMDGAEVVCLMGAFVVGADGVEFVESVGAVWSPFGFLFGIGLGARSDFDGVFGAEAEEPAGFDGSGLDNHGIVSEVSFDKGQRHRHRLSFIRF